MSLFDAMGATLADGDSADKHIRRSEVEMELLRCGNCRDQRQPCHHCKQELAELVGSLHTTLKSIDEDHIELIREQLKERAALLMRQLGISPLMSRVRPALEPGPTQWLTYTERTPAKVDELARGFRDAREMLDPDVWG